MICKPLTAGFESYVVGINHLSILSGIHRIKNHERQPSLSYTCTYTPDSMLQTENQCPVPCVTRLTTIDLCLVSAEWPLPCAPSNNRNSIYMHLRHWNITPCLLFILLPLRQSTARDIAALLKQIHRLSCMSVYLTSPLSFTRPL